MHSNTIIDRLEALRRRMRAQGVAATIIPHTDPHQSEYMSPHWHVREYFSGFDGSAGTLVVTLEGAALWTDSRYFLQADQQLSGTGITLMKEGLMETPEIASYIINVLHTGERVGFDGMLMTLPACEELETKLADAGIEVNATFDPVGELWPDRPALPSDTIYVLDEKYAGEMAVSKLQRLREAVKKGGAEAIFLTKLDEIAWALNLRGSDVECNPVFSSALLINVDGTGILFIDPAKVPDSVREYLDALHIGLSPYGEASAVLTSLVGKVMTAPATLPAALGRTDGVTWVYAPSPVAMMKAVKNEVELRNIREAMRLEGAAMVKAVEEITRRVSAMESVTELDVSEALVRNRSTIASYRGDSFPAIVGYGPNAAIVHYEPTQESNATLHPEGMLLIDTGGQYLYGTTDITRTIALGTPTADESRDFTLVLKGHIALAQAVFPEGTRGAQLDVLARQFLWQEGKNYLHGTGHGVGYFLNVHEGPQSIRLQENPTQLRLGMVTSDEPGLYLAGRYGIRCENLILTTLDCETEFGRFFRFEVLSLFPFDRTLIVTEMLSDNELEWINDYHKKVLAQLSPLLADNEAAAAWLCEACAPINK